MGVDQDLLFLTGHALTGCVDKMNAEGAGKKAADAARAALCHIRGTADSPSMIPPGKTSAKVVALQREVVALRKKVSNLTAELGAKGMMLKEAESGCPFHGAIKRPPGVIQAFKDAHVAAIEQGAEETDPSQKVLVHIIGELIVYIEDLESRLPEEEP